MSTEREYEREYEHEHRQSDPCEPRCGNVDVYEPSAVPDFVLENARNTAFCIRTRDLAGLSPADKSAAWWLMITQAQKPNHVFYTKPLPMLVNARKLHPDGAQTGHIYQADTQVRHIVAAQDTGRIFTYCNKVVVPTDVDQDKVDTWQIICPVCAYNRRKGIRPTRPESTNEPAPRNGAS